LIGKGSVRERGLCPHSKSLPLYDQSNIIISVENRVGEGEKGGEVK